MHTGENERDLTQLEKKAGQKAARTLRRKLKSVLGVLSIKSGSKLFKSTSVRAVMRYDALESLAISTPHYIFKQHYSFEGIKKNGVRMSLGRYDHFNKLFDNTRALDTLLDEISAIRAEEITSKIKF